MIRGKCIKEYWRWRKFNVLRIDIGVRIRDNDGVVILPSGFIGAPHCCALWRHRAPDVADCGHQRLRE